MNYDYLLGAFIAVTFWGGIWYVASRVKAHASRRETSDYFKRRGEVFFNFWKNHYTVPAARFSEPLPQLHDGIVPLAKMLQGKVSHRAYANLILSHYDYRSNAHALAQVRDEAAKQASNTAADLQRGVELRRAIYNGRHNETPSGTGVPMYAHGGVIRDPLPSATIGAAGSEAVLVGEHGTDPAEAILGLTPAAAERRAENIMMQTLHRWERRGGDPDDMPRYLMFALEASHGVCPEGTQLPERLLELSHTQRTLLVEAGLTLAYGDDAVTRRIAARERRNAARNAAMPAQAAPSGRRRMQFDPDED